MIDTTKSIEEDINRQLCLVCGLCRNSQVIDLVDHIVDVNMPALCRAYRDREIAYRSKRQQVTV